MDPEAEVKRRLRRRREQHRRVRQRRRLVAGGGAALLGVLVVAVVLIGAGGGGDGDDDSPPAAAAAKPSALERSRQHRRQDARAIDGVLAYTPFLRDGRKTKRQVALTFDDGPGPDTPKILKILKQHDAPATFFVCGYMLDEFHDISRHAARDGFVIGNHTESHPHMGQLDAATQQQQFVSVEDKLSKYRIHSSHLFRPPYGSFNTETLQLLDDHSELMVLWSVDTGDYAAPGADVIVQRAVDGAKPGAVILMHDAGGDRSQTIEALPRILRALKKRKLKPVTVPQLLADNPPPRNQSIEEATAVPPPGATVSG